MHVCVYSRSYEENPVCAYTSHRCQSEKILDICSASEQQISHFASWSVHHMLRFTVWIPAQDFIHFNGKAWFLFFKSLQITQIFFLWGPSITATWGSYHHDWVICKYISFIICFHTLTAFQSLMWDVLSSCRFLHLFAFCYYAQVCATSLNMLFTDILLNASYFNLPTHVSWRNCKALLL